MARWSQLANMEADASPRQPKVPGVCSEEENLQTRSPIHRRRSDRPVWSSGGEEDEKFISCCRDDGECLFLPLFQAQEEPHMLQVAHMLTTFRRNEIFT